MIKQIYRSLCIASVCFLLLGLASAHAQNRVITGKIADASGQTLPGVNIFKKGTTIGTSTDANGSFSIEANNDDILVISFIGYVSEEVKVDNQNTINITLTEDVSTLQEVVVVGYGEMKRADLSSAQVSIGSEQIAKTINTTLEQAIQGRAAGVYVTQNTGQPGGGISVNIRGVNTINGSNEPLYVIDGIQIQQNEAVKGGDASSTNPLAGINPSDIADMQVLQGPAATAIYGSRGTNGVIVITTKRGKPGETKINYNYTYALQDVPKKLNVLNLPQYAQMSNEIHSIAGGNSPSAFDDPTVLGGGTNWQDALFKTAALKKHQLGISGGAEKTSFYLSGEYFDQDGISLGSAFKRYSTRLNIDNQTRDWLKLGTTIYVNETNNDISATQENLINNALQLAPNIPVRNPDGSWGGADAANGSSLQYTPLNPVAISSLVKNNNKNRQFLGGLNLDAKIIKGLTFRTSLNGKLESGNAETFTPTYRLGDRTNTVATLKSTLTTSSYWNWNQLLQYDLKSGNHDFTIMVSHEAQASTWKSVSGSRIGFLTNDNPDLKLGDASNGATNDGGRSQWAMESYFGRFNYGFKEKYFVQGAIRRDGSVNFTESNRWGTFPSLSAAWRISQEGFMKNITFINELKLRLETGITGNQGNTNYYGPLKVSPTPWGAGFRLERFGNPSLKWEETSTNNIGFNLSVLNSRVQLEGDFYVKKTKNLLIQNPLPDYMGTSGEGSIGSPMVNIGSLENRGWAFSLNTVNLNSGQLKWTSNFNISGFKTKVTEFYSRTAFVDRTSWFLAGENGDKWTQRAAVGSAPWMFRGYLYDGLFQNPAEINASAIPVDNKGNKLPVSPDKVWVGDVKYKDINGDGVIDERDQTNIGNPWPKFSFGFTNTFSFKGFNLNILLTGSYGNQIYNYLRFVNTNPNQIYLGKNLLTEAFDYAKLEGTGENTVVTNSGTSIPRIVIKGANGNDRRFTDQFVEDGSYLRVKNVTLDYTLPASLIGFQHIVRNVGLSAGVQNLFTFTKYKGYDPEVGAYVGQNVDASNQAIGVDYGRYPSTKVYTFKISVDF